MVAVCSAVVAAPKAEVRPPAARYLARMALRVTACQGLTKPYPMPLSLSMICCRLPGSVDGIDTCITMIAPGTVYLSIRLLTVAQSAPL